MSERLAVELARLFAAYPKANGEPYDELTMAVYLDDLSVIPEAEIAVTMRQVRATHTSGFLPSIGEIKTTWAELALRDVVLSEGDAVRWAMRQIGRIGGWTANGGFVEPVDYPDPVVERMMVNFGWSRLAHSEDDDWTRKELAKAYQMARQTVSEQVMAGTITPPPMALPDGPQRPALKAVS